jgi:hypothetical protein
MALLPDLEPFCLGQPLDAGRNINYIGGIEVSALSSDVPVPLPEFADFTTDESSDEDDEDELALSHDCLFCILLNFVFLDC